MGTELAKMPQTTALRVAGDDTQPIAAPRKGRQVASFQPSSMGELMQYAQMISDSNLVPKELRGKPADILLALQHGAELGLTTAMSLQSIAVINGRPSMFADAVLALVRNARLADNTPLMRSFTEGFETDAKGEVIGAWCETLRAGDPTPTRRTFSRKQAQQAKLIGKPGPWTEYPERMLQMRARSWALRDTYPDVLRGLHVAEEAMDYTMEGASLTVPSAPRGNPNLKKLDPNKYPASTIRTRKEAMQDLFAAPGFTPNRTDPAGCAAFIGELLGRTLTVADIRTIDAAELDQAREALLARIEEEDDTNPFGEAEDELLHVEAATGTQSAQAAGL